VIVMRNVQPPKVKVEDILGVGTSRCSSRPGLLAAVCVGFADSVTRSVRGSGPGVEWSIE
jgi:hypothetical protein